MDEAIKLLTMYGVPTAIATALIACGVNLFGISKRYMKSRMSSDNTDRVMRDLECLIDSEWNQEDDEVGFIPPPPPARRAVTQSSRATAANVFSVEEMNRLLLTGSGTSQPAGVITAGSKPKQVEPPKIDNPRKRKVTLE